MKNKILITGATGFIGSHLAKRLVEKGNQIKCLVREQSPQTAIDFLKSIDAELVYGDLLDKASLKNAVTGVDMIFHLGGGGRIAMPKDIQYKINANGTKNILDALLEQGKVKKFVHVSTCAVMGDTKGNVSWNETYPRNPSNLAYSKAKTVAEEVALSYKDKIPLVVVRFSGVYGTPLIKKSAADIGGVTPALMILSAIKNGNWRYMGDGRNFVNLFYVDDAVRGLELAAEKGKLGEIYIIASAKSIRMYEMVESVAHVLGVEAPKGHIPIYLARLFTTLFELKASVLGGTPQMTQEMITGFTGNLNVDISKAMNELDYEPKVDLVKGMTETAQWYEKNGYL